MNGSAQTEQLSRSAFEETHFAVSCWAEWWGFSVKTVREWFRDEFISELRDVTVDVLEDFRRTRKIASITWKVELQALRTFFRSFVSRKWITSNPAKEMKSPRNIKPNGTVPYTLREESEILAAVYEQLRARAGVVAPAYPSAFRMSARFEKSGVKNAHAHRYRHTLATRLLAQGTQRRSCGSTTVSGPRGARTTSTDS